MRENGWLSYIEDEDSVPVIRHRLPPTSTFGNQAPSARVDRVQAHPRQFVEDYIADALPPEGAASTRHPSLSPDEKRLYLLKEKARLLDELAKLQLRPE